MKLSFRQGIARYQTDITANPIYLQHSANGSFIDLIVSPDPTVIAFAHRTANYIIEESKTVTQAWGPFSGTTTQYLYWDINMLSGQMTRGFTAHPPIYAGNAPTTPVNDQHWFNTTKAVMSVWNGTVWIEKIRVFAGYLRSGAIIVPYPLGSQCGITGDFSGGNLVLDIYNIPIRQSDGTFLTSATSVLIVNNSSRKVRFESEVMTGMAAEPIPKYSLVQMRAGRRVVLGRYTDNTTRIAGIVLEDLFTNEVGNIVTDGLIRNESWAWPSSSVNRPVFCGANGEVTLTPPLYGVLQAVGFVYDTDAVYMNIQMPIILDDVTTIAPPIPPTPPPPLAPVPDFFALTTSGTAPFTVSFSNLTTNTPATYQWDFTSDGTIDSLLDSPTYTYAAPGTYDVTLIATNPYGVETIKKAGYIVVSAASAEGGVTNISVDLGGPSQIDVNRTFQLSMSIKNTGFITATTVTRVLTVPDVRNQSIAITGLPPGTVTSRNGKNTVYTLPSIPTIPSNIVYGPIFLTVQAPPITGPLVIYAAVSCDQPDPEMGNNTASLSVEVVL